MVENPDEDVMQGIETITLFRTADGEEFPSVELAQANAKRLRALAKANEMLDSGATVGEALLVLGMFVAEGSPLRKITSQTPLLIPEYEGRLTPAYRVVSIATDHLLWVVGITQPYHLSFSAKEGVMELERIAWKTLAAERRKLDSARLWQDTF